MKSFRSILAALALTLPLAGAMAEVTSTNTLMAGVGILRGGSETHSYLVNLIADPTYFNDTEKATLNDFGTFANHADYLMPALLLDLGLTAYTPRERNNVFTLQANYGIIPLLDDWKSWTVAAGAKMVSVSGDKHLQVALWTYTTKTDLIWNNNAAGKPLPLVAVQFLTNGVWTTLFPEAVNRLWGMTNGIAEADVLYGPTNHGPTLDFAFAPGSRLPEEVRTVWGFPDTLTLTNLPVFHAAELVVQSPNLSGGTLTASIGPSRHGALPLTVSSAQAVEGLTTQLSAMNAPGTPPVVATNLQWRFTDWPASLNAGQAVSTTLELDFPANTPPGTYTGLLQLDALNASPTALAVSVTVMAGLNDGLMAYYPLDGTLNDQSGNGNHLAAHGSPQFIAGFKSSGLSFHGQGDYCVSASRSANFENSEMTVSAWVNSTKTGFQGVAGYFGISGNLGYGIDIGTDGRFSFIQARGNYQGGWSYAIAAQPQAGDGKWHHVVGVRRSGTAYLYIDGILQPYTTTLAPAYGSACRVFLGWDNFTPVNQYFGGLLDEVRIYNRALSATEVSQLYEQDWPMLTALRHRDSVLLSWATNAPAVTLVSATNLGPGMVWTTVSAVPSVSDGQFVVTNLISGPRRFFSLQPQ